MKTKITIAYNKWNMNKKWLLNYNITNINIGDNVSFYVNKDKVNKIINKLNRK